MPESHQSPCHEYSDRRGQLHAVDFRKREWIKDVLLYPRRKTYMPSLPEIIHIFRKEWITEIKHDVEAHNPADAPRHIRVARKVSVELEDKYIGADQYSAARQIGGGVKNTTYYSTKAVGYQDLLVKTSEDEPASLVKHASGDFSGPGYLWQEIPRSLNRA